MPNLTKEATVQVVTAVAETIRELREVPSGHLYARLMGIMNLEQYNQMIALLKRTKLVSESNHVLRWTGPLIGSN